jgi:hypothetical protein
MQAELDDAFLAQCAERRRQQQPEPEKPQPKARPGMTESDHQWVRERIEATVIMIAEEVIRRECELRVEIIARRDAILADIAALREEAGQLRAAVTLLEAHKMPKEGSVESLRGRHVRVA